MALFILFVIWGLSGDISAGSNDLCSDRPRRGQECIGMDSLRCRQIDAQNLGEERDTMGDHIAPIQDFDKESPETDSYLNEPGPSGRLDQELPTRTTVSPLSSIDNAPEQQQREKCSHEKILSCDICGKNFNTVKRLNRHKKIHEAARRFACNICGRNFARQDYLKDHMLVHENKMPFTCKYCNKCFKRKKNLKDHSKTHSSEKSFLCKLCDKSFRRKPNLTRHMNIHTDEKPVTCKLCGKCFKDKASLARHTEVHADEKIFQCKQCSKSFNRKTYLRLHMKTHSRGKSFQCMFCAKYFKKEASLEKHEEIHKNQEPFTCEEFTSRAEIATHRNNRILQELVVVRESTAPNQQDIPNQVLNIGTGETNECILIEPSDNQEQVSQDIPNQVLNIETGETGECILIEPNDNQEQVGQTTEEMDELDSDFAIFHALSNPGTFNHLMDMILDANGEFSCEELNEIQEEIDREIERISNSNPEREDPSSEGQDQDMDSQSASGGLQREIDDLYKEIVMVCCDEGEYPCQPGPSRVYNSSTFAID